jgi:alpha-amylase
MKTICFYFQVHQPFRLKKYRFFEIGDDHYYFDDFSNRSILKKVAQKCYLPMNNLLLDLIQEYGSAFKVSFSLSGVAIEQFEKYAPEVLDSFKALAKTGSVEFLAETYSHSLSALKSKDEFERQVKLQVEKIKEHFGQTPQVFRNTELIYSDEIGKIVADMGYKAILTEGAKHILGWKSPNFLYFNALRPKLKVLLKNYTLSDDIAFRFSNKAWAEWPLTAEKYVSWLNQISPKEEVVNLFMDYETFGEHQWADTGIFDFMRALPKYVFSDSPYQFLTPSEVASKLQPVAAIHVPHPISWADEERDLTAWLGNEMQDEAFDKLYSLEKIVKKINDPDIQHDWLLLQTSDHFYYMCTKFFSDGDVHMYFNPYDNPYNAFINYMNILSDFMIRLEKASKTAFGDEEPQSIDKIEQIIAKYQAEIDRLKKKMEELKKSQSNENIKKIQAKSDSKIKQKPKTSSKSGSNKKTKK